MKLTITRATPTGWRICFGPKQARIERARDGAWYLDSGSHRGLTLGGSRKVAIRNLFALAAWE